MARPVILAVDDEAGVLTAVEHDLRRHYGEDFRVLGADSGEAAADALTQLRLRATPVAAVVADQRMPGMSGVELLEQVREEHPDAKRVLLTAYADTDAAIDAINRAQLDHYLLKPWDPPEERLYPVLDDLLDDWWAAYRPPFEGLRVIGHRWSRATHEARDFLARNQVPYEWLDLEADGPAQSLLEDAGAGSDRLPVVLLADGSALAQPSLAELAEGAGLRVRAELPFYDLVVVGAGPAGLAAGVYAGSEGLRTLIVEGVAAGGQAGMSNLIENYLGFPRGLSGSDLARRATTQATRFGSELLTSQPAIALEERGSGRVVRLADGSEVGSHAVVVATGVSYRTLGAPGADDLVGAGVYYTASRTEAAAHEGEDVFLVGGGNSAGQAAMYLARHARHVTLLIRGDSLAASMSQYLIDQLEQSANVTIRHRTQVVEATGDQRLDSLTLADTETGATEKTPAGALFVFVGMAPRTDWLGDRVARDRAGFVLTGEAVPSDGRVWPLSRSPLALETSVPGVFAAGDVRAGSTKRVASAVGEGAIAVRYVHEYLAKS